MKKLLELIKKYWNYWRRSEPEYGNWASLHEHLLPRKSKKHFDIHLKIK